MPSTASIGKCVMGAYGSAGQARDALHAIKKHWGAERLPKHIALAADLVDQARRALFAAEAALSRVVRDPAQN